MTDVSAQGFGQSTPRPDADPLKAEAQAAREKIGEAAHAVRAEAASFGETAADMASEQVEQGKDAAASAVSDFAQAIRKASDELGERDQTLAARLVSQAAEGLETFSRSVSEKSPEEMLAAVRAFGRENPTAFVAGAVLAGIAVGRFARSSATREDGEQALQGDGSADTGPFELEPEAGPAWGDRATAPLGASGGGRTTAAGGDGVDGPAETGPDPFFRQGD